MYRISLVRYKEGIWKDFALYLLYKTVDRGAVGRGIVDRVTAQWRDGGMEGRWGGQRDSRQKDG